MATMKVSLPDAMLAWVEGQTRSGRYPNASEYVCDLIRRDQDLADRIAHLQRLVDEGLGSGVGERSLREVRAEGRRQCVGVRQSRDPKIIQLCNAAAYSSNFSVEDFSFLDITSKAGTTNARGAKGPAICTARASKPILIAPETAIFVPSFEPS